MTKTTNLTLLEKIMKEVQTLTLVQQQEVLDFILFLHSSLHQPTPQFSEDDKKSRIRKAFLELAKKKPSKR